MRRNNTRNRPDFLSKAPLSKAPLKVPSPPAPKIIFVIGSPGSGKGTLCSRICAEYPGRFKHLSVGDYLREQFCTNSSGGASYPSGLPVLEPECLPPNEIAKYVREGRLLPPETIIPLIKEKLLVEGTSSSTCWLIDGFPRNQETAIAFENEVSMPQLCGAQRSELSRHATLRNSACCQLGDPKSVFILTCDDAICRQRFLARQRSSSDNAECFERRLKEYNENLEPMYFYYTDLEILVSAE